MPDAARPRRETFADALARGDGGRFDAMRLGAALAVVVSHAFEIAQGSRANEPFLRLTGALTFGELTVLVFFALSGFLLTTSLGRDADLRRFAERRARRIFPGLVACVVVLVFVAGPLLTILPAADYFASAQTWGFLLNAALVPHHYALPGVFLSAPSDAKVDAPLWTLLYEAVCYVLLALLGARGRPGWRALASALAASALVHPLAEGWAPPGLLALLRPFSVFAPVFFAGALVAALADRIPRDGRLALAAVVFFAAASIAGNPFFGFLVAGVYLTLYVAASGPRGVFRRMTGGADLSYGVYLYGWPIQQTLVTTGLGATVLANAGLGAALALLAGFASWSAVERRFLARHARADVRRPPAPAAVKSPQMSAISG